jgi:PST family polysaccharide transporter
MKEDVRTLASATPDDGGMTGHALRGLFWMFLGTGGQAVVQLLVLVVLARLLTPADFGVVAAALVVVGFSTIFSQLGIGPAVVQRHELHATHLRTGFTISVAFGILLAGLIWLLAPAVAAFFHHDDLVPVLRALSLVFPLQGLSVVAESLLQRELRFRYLAALELATVALGYGAVGIVLAFAGLGVWALVAAHLAQFALKTVLLLVLQPHPRKPLLDRSAFKELMYFGGGFTAARIGNYLAGQGDNLVIGRWLGAVALGVYGRAYHLVAGPAMLLGGVLDRVLFPAMAKVQDQPERLGLAYRRGVALIALVVLPFSTALVLLSPELVLVLLGPEWDQVTVPLQILAAGLLFRTSYRMSDSIARATGAVYRRAWRQGVFAALVLGLSWVGHHWGLPGVALGVVVAVALNFLLMAHLSLQLAALTWRGFLTAHVPGVALSALVGLEIWGSASLLRSSEASAWMVVLLSSAATLPSLLLIRVMPRLFLGQEGRWMIRTLTARFAQ